MNVLASDDNIAFNHTVVQTFPVAVLELVVRTSHHQLLVFFFMCILQKQLGHCGRVVRVNFHPGSDCRDWWHHCSVIVVFHRVIKIRYSLQQQTTVEFSLDNILAAYTDIIIQWILCAERW